MAEQSSAIRTGPVGTRVRAHVARFRTGRADDSRRPDADSLILRPATAGVS